MEALALNGMYNPYSIKTKADAMKYAFDLTTEKDFSTGETKVNVEKAMEVYKCFTSAIELPDYDSPITQGIVEQYNKRVGAITELMLTLKAEE